MSDETNKKETENEKDSSGMANKPTGEILEITPEELVGKELEAEPDLEPNKPETLEIKKEDRAKALEEWFEGDLKAKKEKIVKVAKKSKTIKKAKTVRSKRKVVKNVEPAELIEPTLLEEEQIESPRNWKKIGLILAQSFAMIILVASIIGNVYIYSQQKEITNKFAENISSSQKAKESYQKEINQLTAQVESLKKASAKKTEDAIVNNEEIKVAIYNGTNTAGLAKEMQKTLEEKLKGVKIVALGNAKHDDYTKTKVMAIGKKVEEAKKISEAIGGYFSALPLDENKPEADVLVVVGK